MYNIQNFNNLITILETDIDNPLFVYLETVETKNEDNTSCGQISIVPTKKSIDLFNNLKNYTEKEFKILILNKIKEQININKNTNDYTVKLKELNIEETLKNDKQFDIKNKSQKEIHEFIKRLIIIKINLISNMIAINSRIGPANTIIMHYDFYKEFNLKDMLPNYNIILDNNIDKKELIIFRLEQKIEQSGMILCYNKKNHNFSIYSPLNKSYNYFSSLNINMKLKDEIRKEKLSKLINV